MKTSSECTLTLAQCISMALADAERKFQKGLLFHIKDYPEEEETFDWSNGDPETVYSIAALYCQFYKGDYTEAQIEIEEILFEKYPELDDRT